MNQSNRYDDTDESCLLCDDEEQDIQLIQRRSKKIYKNLKIQKNQIIQKIKRIPVLNNIITNAKILMIQQDGFIQPNIQLNKIVQKFRFSKYLPKKSFNAVQIWFDDCQADVFEKRKIKLITRDEESMKVNLDKICQIISKSEKVMVKVKKIKISHQVANGQLPFGVDIERLGKINQLGMIKYRVYKKGAIVLYGKDFQEICNAYDELCIQLREYAI